MARVARACGFGIGGLRFRGCPRFVPHSTDPANPAKSHEPPNLPDLPDLPKRCALPDRHPVRGGAKHRFETKTRVPKRSAALSLAKKPAMSHPAFRMRLPRYRPQAAQPLPAAFRAGLTSAQTCQSQSRPRRKALVCRCRRSPRPGPRTLPRARFANRGGPALPYIWAANPGKDFGGLSVAKSSKNQ